MDRIEDERLKLLATALNNLGVASIVTGVFAPSAAYLTGTLAADDPWRLASLCVVWLAMGLTLLASARYILRGLN